MSQEEFNKGVQSTMPDGVRLTIQHDDNLGHTAYLLTVHAIANVGDGTWLEDGEGRDHFVLGQVLGRNLWQAIQGFVDA